MFVDYVNAILCFVCVGLLFGEANKWNPKVLTKKSNCFIELNKE